MSTFPATDTLPQNSAIVARWLQDEASGNRVDIVGLSDLAPTNMAAGTGFIDLGAAFDNAADFERGNSGRLLVADNAALSIVGDLSFSVLAKVEDAPSNQKYTLMSKRKASGGDDFSYNAFYEDIGGTKTLGMQISSNGTTETIKSVTKDLSTGNFSLITVVYDASAGEADFYVSGVQVGSTQTGLPTSIKDSVAGFLLGADDSNNPGNFFDGLMNDAIIWGAELTAAEVLTMNNLYITALAVGRANAFFI